MKSWQQRGEVLDSDDDEIEGRVGGNLASKIPEEERDDLVQGSEGTVRWGDGDGDAAVGTENAANQHGGSVARHSDERTDSYRALNISQLESIRTSQRSAPHVRPEVLFQELSSPAAGPAADTQDTSSLSSVPSSPLSERVVSPSPPSSLHPGLGVISAQKASDVHLWRLSRSPPMASSTLVQNKSWEDSSPLKPENNANILHGENVQITSRPSRLRGNYRTLRTRQKKQLHPYMFDQIQYRRQCRERGLQPYRIADEEVKNAETQITNLSGNENQSQGAQSSSAPQQILERSDLGRTSQVNSSTISQEPISIFHSDSPTDVDGSPSASQWQDGARTSVKRQKLFHGRVEHTSNHQPKASEQQQNSILTPPPTSSDPNTTNIESPPPRIFRMPKGLATATTQTPLRSLYVPLEADDESSSEEDVIARRRKPSPSRPRLMSSDAITSSPKSSDTEHSSDDTGVQPDHMQHERKRIKGVLPASWLRMDLQAQHRGGRTSVRTSTPFKYSSPKAAGGVKGIAQIVKRPTTSSSAHLILPDSSDGDEDDRPLQVTPCEIVSRQARSQGQTRLNIYGNRNLNDDSDEMEMDWFDPMFSGHPRKTTSTAKTYKQRKLKYGKVNGVPRDDFGAKKPNKQPHSEDHFLGNHKRNSTRLLESRNSSRVPNLCIMDSIDQVASNETDLPQFLRLAIRRARQQQNCGRHSPSGKQVRLATEKDTADALSTLMRWRQGAILPKTSPRDNNETATARRPSYQGQISIQRQPALADTTSDPGRHQITKNPKLVTYKGLPAAPKKTVLRQPRLRQIRLDSMAASIIPRPEDGDQDEEHPRTSTIQLRSRARETNRSNHRRLYYRNGQLESLETDHARRHRSAVFERRINCLTGNVGRSVQATGTQSLPLDRFIREVSVVESAEREDQSPSEVSANPAAIGPGNNLRRPLRKRPPGCLDASTREYRQTGEPLPDILDTDLGATSCNNTQTVQLQGLGPFGTLYATDYDVVPLHPGTYFQDSTFIGSGDFAANLNLMNRDLDKLSGHIRIHIQGEVLEWGSWNETVSSQLAFVLQAISNANIALHDNNDSNEAASEASLVQANVEYLLRSITRYFAKCLAFVDPIDRNTCVDSLHRLVEDLLGLAEETKVSKSPYISTRCLQTAVVLANTALSIASDPRVSSEAALRSRNAVSTAARHLVTYQSPALMEGVRYFCEQNQRASVREGGISESETAVSTVVILRHVLTNLGHPDHSIWNALILPEKSRNGELRTVQAFDKVWYDIFSLLPLLQISQLGIASLDYGHNSDHDGVPVVRSLLSELLDKYRLLNASHRTKVNEYLRATLLRCNNLVTRWGWWRCDGILNAIFDFFGRRYFANLQNEEPRGSPSFLGELEKHPSLNAQSGDSAFHIFLKTLASGLEGMHRYRIFEDKKIKSFAWRLIPNHGRTYRKDTEVYREDIDALRNHHDLLCTLYYASPPGHRIPLKLLHRLVDHSSSHREACRLNIIAWSNLAAFQASTSEPLECLDALCSWYRDILEATVKQYRLARTEVEDEIAAAAANSTLNLSRELAESTIARNQRQMLATLLDALSALKRALSSASNEVIASLLVRETAFWHVFALFDPSSRYLNNMLEEALSCVEVAIEACKRPFASKESQSISEDSQEFGDSSALHEFAATQAASTTPWANISSIVREPIAHLVSNVFGGDIAADESLLSKVVDVWFVLAEQTVRQGERNWASYIIDYASDSWTQLRDTAQKRKFTSLFLAKVVNSSDCDADKTGVMALWLQSLVERDSMLKFQHLFTTTLLNSGTNEVLLRNLPFATDNDTNRYQISLRELRDRRLSLVSSILHNMQYDCEDALRNRPGQYKSIKSGYEDMLWQMMRSMKSNYIELQGFNDRKTAEVDAQGAYVTFVQHIVSYLQQYTAGICAVDGFFTDSSVFPLPAGDPTYVVGRLKSYTPKLAESRARKQLVSFIQNVSERAAVDHQQQYLVDQMVTVMTGSFENGDWQAPNLRQVLCLGILPAYAEEALSTTSSWIIALPMIKAWAAAVEQLLYDAVMEDENSRHTAEMIVHGFLWAMKVLIVAARRQCQGIQVPHIMRVLACAFRSLQSCVTIVKYLHTLLNIREELYFLFRQSSTAGAAIRALFSESQSAAALESSLDDGKDIAVCPWPETLDFARAEIKRTIHNDWHTSNGRHFVRRGGSSREVPVDLEDEATERCALFDTLNNFEESLREVFGNHTWVRVGHETTHESAKATGKGYSLDVETNGLVV